MKHLSRAALVAAILMLVHSLYFWGGIGLTPNVGERVLMQTKKQLGKIGVGFYTHAGKQTMAMVAPDAARAYAAAQVGHVYPALDGDKYMAIEKIRAAMSPLQNLSHLGTPFAFLLAILLFWLRPKPLKSLGR